MGLKTFERGIHPSYHKELTASKNTVKAALPKTVFIPLQQHAGAQSEPLVKKGEAVVEGRKIGDVKAFVSAPVHATINGKVKDIDYVNHPSAGRVLGVIIDGDGTEKDWKADSLPDINGLSPEDIRAQVREAGIVGMGGAAFPTFVKLSLPKGKTIDSILLNGCECEPYLTADDRLMVEEPEKVVWGLKALMKAAGARSGFIGIESNKPEAIESLRKAGADSEAIKVIELDTKYPQGAEKMLIKAALGRKVPAGKLPLDVGVVVNNVGTATAVYDAICLKKPLIDRVVTISGNAVAEPKNLCVRIGTLFEEVIAQCGGINAGGDEYEVLNGGPMMGIAQSTMTVPVVKGTSGITVISARSIKPVKYDSCIRCSNCVEVCPMGLMPYRLGDYGRTQMVDELKLWGGFSCIECGCCSYICPSKRPLLQWIRVGKFKARQQAKPASA
ncbi:MAG: electron transport complex subunit RsxC [Deltaproteobacteria bacterium]|nr:electron transport complex subunit RsxC [Deltaproteobacteria bacterium]